MAAGNLAVVVAVANGGTCTTVTSTPSNTFKAWLVQTDGASNRHTVFVARNVASGTNTFVATCSGASSFVSQMVYNYSIATAADVAGSATGTGGTPTFTTNLPVGSSSEAVIGSIFDNANFRNWVAGSGYTIQAEVNQSGSNFLGASEDNNTKTGLSGTQSASITGVSTDVWTGSIITVSSVAGTQDAADINVDFEGLTDTVNPTVAALKSSTHGILLTWTASASAHFTGATGSQGATTPAAHLLGASSLTGSGSLGLAYSTGGTTTHDLTARWPVSSEHVSWIGQFKTSLPQNDTNGNAYSMLQVRDVGSNSLMPQLQANGTKLVIALECTTGPSGTIDMPSNTLRYVMIDAPDNGGTATMREYDSSGTEVSGSPVTCSTAAGVINWFGMDFGITGAEAESSGSVISWDNIRISLTGATLTP